MQKTTLPNLPARRAVDFMLDEFDPPRYARVIYSPQESRPDRKVIEAQAFEVDATGNLVAFDTGAASRTQGTMHTISMTGMGDTHTIVPGWVRVVGVFNAESPQGSPDALPEGTQVLSAKPASAAPGDLVLVGDTLFRWDVGALDRIVTAKAEELAGLLRNSAAAQDFDL